MRKCAVLSSTVSQLPLLLSTFKRHDNRLYVPNFTLNQCVINTTGQYSCNDAEALTLLFLNETHFFNFCRYHQIRHFLYRHPGTQNLLPIWNSGAGKQSLQHPQHINNLPWATTTTLGHPWYILFGILVPDTLIDAKKSPKWVIIFSKGYKVSTGRHDILNVACLGLCEWWSFEHFGAHLDWNLES